MGLIHYEMSIDGHTGEIIPDPHEPLNEHAVSADSYVFGPVSEPTRDGLRADTQITINAAIDLRLFGFERRGGATTTYLYREVEAAIAHPSVTLERLIEGIEPPERGRRIALYNAIFWALEYGRREWCDPSPGEALVGPADGYLEPMLLDVAHEVDEPIRHDQCVYWLCRTYQRIPESAARLAVRCLWAAVNACRHTHSCSLDDQLTAIAAREGVEYRNSRGVHPGEFTVFECARDLLLPCYKRRRPVLWRPWVDLSSSATRVRLELRPRDAAVEPVRIEIDQSCVQFGIAAESTTTTHDADRDQLNEIGKLLADRARAVVTKAREERSMHVLPSRAGMNPS